MYRLAILLALLALPAAGCGGSGSDEDDSRGASPPVAQAGGGTTAARNAGERSGEGAARTRKRETAKRRRRDSEKERGARGSGGAQPRTYREKLERAAPADVANLIRQAVRGTLPLFGLKQSGIEIENGGRRVNVLITRASACRAVARDEPAMSTRIKEAAPIIRALTFEVAGTGKQLGYYVLECPKPEIPDGPGKVVFSKTAVGGVTTKPIQIRGKSWAIEYENHANFLGVIVSPPPGTQETYYEPIGSQKREVGRKVYRGEQGGPTSIVLRIQGGGLWTVRVKDMR